MALPDSLNTREVRKFSEVGSSVAVNVNLISGFVSETYDYFSIAYPSATQEVYTFKTGGSGGTLVATLTLNYTDATKDFLSNGTKVVP